MLKCAGLFFACGILCRAANSGAVQYGKQLVEEVAKCGDCHTPRKATGGLDASKWLKGASLPKASPDLTASGHLFREWGEQGMVKFLETGVGPTGHPADPPMPTYKLKKADAEAMVEFLESLK